MAHLQIRPGMTTEDRSRKDNHDHRPRRPHPTNCDGYRLPAVQGTTPTAVVERRGQGGPIDRFNRWLRSTPIATEGQSAHRGGVPTDPRFFLGECVTKTGPMWMQLRVVLRVTLIERAVSLRLVPDSSWETVNPLISRFVACRGWERDVRRSCDRCPDRVRADE